MVSPKPKIIICLSLSAILHCGTNIAHAKEDNQTPLSHYNLGDPSSYAGWVENLQYQCGGYYLHSEWDKESTQSNWEVSADHIEIMSQGHSNLSGHVTLQQGQRFFTADHLRIKTNKKQIEEIETQGDLVYTDPSLQVFGQSGHWLAQEDELTIQEPSYYYFTKHARGKAQSISVEGKTKVSLRDAMYTTCAPNQTTWQLQGESISLDRDSGKGYARHIRLKFKNTTVFYWPYLQFPIDSNRHSGFLYPQYGSTSQSGFELSAPYYWNIAPNYDATFTPRILMSRGIDLQSEFRYLTQHSDGTAKLHFLPNDKKYRDFRRDNLQSPPIVAPNHDPRLAALESGNHRVALNLLHQSRFNDRWLFDIDYTYVGDDNYFYDLENDIGSASTTKLNQMARLQYEGYHWRHSLTMQSYDLLHPLFGPVNEEDYAQLPKWGFYGHYPKLGAFDFAIDGEVTRFTHAKEALTGNPVTEGTRYHLRPGLSAPYQKWWGFFTPRVQLDFLSYHLELGQAERLAHFPAHASRMIPIFDMDAGLYFDKYYHNNFVQTLEPRLYYLYVPTRSQNTFPKFDTSHIDFSFYQMFRDNRFSGKDRLGDTHQTTLALTSRLLNHAGDEKLRMTIGEIFYFKERSVGLCSSTDMACLFKEDPDREKHFSPIIANMIYTPSDHWTASTGIEWNPNHSQADKGYANLEYAPSVHSALSLNYYWMRKNPYEEQLFLVERPLNQADIGFFIPLNKQWDTLGHYRYDIQNKRLIEVLAGVEYDSCCFAFQIVGHRSLRPNDGLSKVEYANSIFFQVLFKGLSNVGSKKADNKLLRSIPRYSPFAKRNDIH